MIALAKPMLGIEENLLVSEVLSSGKLAHGEYVERFEGNFWGASTALPPLQAPQPFMWHCCL